MAEKIPGIKPLVFIIEGCDLAGKGYLINALSKKYPSIVMKYTKRPLSKEKKETIEFKSYLYCFLDFINNNRQTKTIIVDRFYPSEMVYSRVKRGYEAWGDSSYRRMEKSIMSLPHMYIYCNPGVETLIKRLKYRGDDYINEGDIKKLCDRYDRFFRETKMNKLNLDTSKSIDEMLEIINHKLEFYEYKR